MGVTEKPAPLRQAELDFPPPSAPVAQGNSFLTTLHHVLLLRRAAHAQLHERGIAGAYAYLGRTVRPNRVPCQRL